MIDNKISCFSCGKELKNFDIDSIHPMQGLHFVTYGHYGSTVFDPIDGSRLDIVVCDECIVKHKDRVHGDVVAPKVEWKCPIDDPVCTEPCGNQCCGI